MAASLIPSTSTEVTSAVYCHLETRTRSTRQLRVACAGREHCRPDYQIVREGYVCYGLELVVQGQGELRMNGKTYRLLPGSLFLYGPGISHTIKCDPRAPMVKYFVDFFGGSNLEIFQHGAIEAGEARRTIELEAMSRLFEELIREGKKAAPISREICAQYLRLILLKSTESSFTDLRPFSQSLNNFQRCRAYIEEHATTLSGLGALAKAMHLEPRYICRLFKRFRLPTPHRYLTTCRLNHAAELLISSPHAIKSVAAQTGYEDALHFSRAFRHHFRCSPSEFRRLGRN